MARKAQKASTFAPFAPFAANIVNIYAHKTTRLIRRSVGTVAKPQPGHVHASPLPGLHSLIGAYGPLLCQTKVVASLAVAFVCCSHTYGAIVLFLSKLVFVESN
eukprot:4852361-Pleurochrysis_carterae.AAC.2